MVQPIVHKLTIAQKFEQFFRLFEPRSVETAIHHFLHKPIDKRYELGVGEHPKEQKVIIIFSDQSLFNHVEKVH